MDNLEAAKDGFVNQWNHCAGKKLHAQNSEIACECGQSWPWIGTLGEAMESLEWAENITKAEVATAAGQLGFF